MAYGINAPWGLRPAKRIGGTTWDVYEEYPLGTNLTNNTDYSQPIFSGDLVCLDVYGCLIRFVPVADGAINAYSQVPIGVFQGCSYLSQSSVNATNPYQQSRFWPGVSANSMPNPIIQPMGRVIVDSNCIFDMQADNNVGLTPNDPATANAHGLPIGAAVTVIFNVNNGTTTYGDPVLGDSGMMIDSGSGTSPDSDVPLANFEGASYPLKIVGVTPVPGNQYGIPFMNFLVKLNSTAFSAGQVGV